MSKIESYVRDAKGQPVLQGMLNFPLYGSVGNVMARGHPTQELGERIRQMMRIHSDPHRMPSFLDNHDVDRFLKGGNELALRQSLALIMTLPGIPTLYYGTEQGFKEQRAAMFATGYGSGGRDHFDQRLADRLRHHRHDVYVIGADHHDRVREQVIGEGDNLAQRHPVVAVDIRQIVGAADDRALVIRDGLRQRIAGREVVVGDILLLEQGDRIAADALPFVGHDRWHAYELSWLDARGKPRVATATLTVPCTSPCLIESKSLKLYLWSYRDLGAFHEAVTNTILDDLVAALSPRRMTVETVWKVRGGILTTVTASHP